MALHCSICLQTWAGRSQKPKPKGRPRLGQVQLWDKRQWVKIVLSIGYGSIPINTIFSGMNIHLPAILMFTRGTRFWHTANWPRHFVILSFTAMKNKAFFGSNRFEPIHNWGLLCTEEEREAMDLNMCLTLYRGKPNISIIVDRIYIYNIKIYRLYFCQAKPQVQSDAVEGPSLKAGKLERFRSSEVSRRQQLVNPSLQIGLFSAKDDPTCSSNSKVRCSAVWSVLASCCPDFKESARGTQITLQLRLRTSRQLKGKYFGKMVTLVSWHLNSQWANVLPFFCCPSCLTPPTVDLQILGK